MGMYVSRLHKVPTSGYEYYVYIVDSWSGGKHTALIEGAFLPLAKRLGGDALVVTGPPGLSDELFNFLQQYSPESFAKLELLFHETSCLIFSRGELRRTKHPVLVLPLVVDGPTEKPPAGATDSDVEEFLCTVLQPITSVLAVDSMEAAVKKVGGDLLPLGGRNGGVIVAVLRHLNECLELKPNIAGLGVNLNQVVEKIIGRSERHIPLAGA